MKQIIDKLDLIKIKMSSLWKAMSREWEQAKNWKKIFSQDTSDERLLSKIQKELLKLNNMKTNNPIKK